MPRKMVLHGLWPGMAWMLSGCGAEDIKAVLEDVDGETTEQTIKVSSAQQASAFLSRATFGPAMEDIDGLLKTGNYNQWLDEQFAEEPGYHVAWAEVHARGASGTGDLKDNPEDWKKRG